MKCATYFKAFSKLRYFALIGPYFFNRKTLFPHMHLGSESGVGSSGDKCLWSSHLGTLCTLKNVYPDFTSLQNLFYQRAIVDKGVWHSGIHSACQPDELGSVWPLVHFFGMTKRLEICFANVGCSIFALSEFWTFNQQKIVLCWRSNQYYYLL